MFTPLFLGAQLLVPSAEDIQHELLAEWMRREGATVTHLTPGTSFLPLEPLRKANDHKQWDRSWSVARRPFSHRSIMHFWLVIS